MKIHPVLMLMAVLLCVFIAWRFISGANAPAPDRAPPGPANTEHRGQLEAEIHKVVVPVMGSVAPAGARQAPENLREVDQAVARQEEMLDDLIK